MIARLSPIGRATGGGPGILALLNFFGHVAVASWVSASPAVALGSMLPDLASMAGARPLRVERADVERGIELHHRTDAAFHALPAFAALCAETTTALRARGIDRGPARAAAHVGVELALDGVLLDDSGAATLYRDALEDTPAAACVVWERGGDRFAELLTRLRRRGVPAGYRDPDALTAAVCRALSRRPRLAISEAAEPLLAEQMPAIRERVERASPALLRELEAAVRAT